MEDRNTIEDKIRANWDERDLVVERLNRCGRYLKWHFPGVLALLAVWGVWYALGGDTPLLLDWVLCGFGLVGLVVAWRGYFLSRCLCKLQDIGWDLLDEMRADSLAGLEDKS